MSNLDKKYYHNIDLDSNELKAGRIYNLTTTQRTALTLTTNDKGYVVYDTTLLSLYIWNGSLWQTYNTGTVTSVSAGTGMSFTTITTSGLVSIDTTKVPYFLGGISGTPSNTTYLRGDGQWTSISASGGILNGIASGTDTYTVTISGVAAYNDGDAYLIRFTNGNTTGCTLNINSLGAKSLYRNNDGQLIGGDIWDGAEMLCIYNSTLNGFQCIGTSPNALFAYVTNADSVSITKGQPVYAFSGTGDRMTVKRAYNTGDSTSAKTVGVVVSTSIGVNQKGIIITQGLLDGLSILPTPTYTDGDSLYLGSTAGSITNVKQYAPNHLVYLGTVTSASNGSAGRWYVRVQNGYELDELHNVQAQTPTYKDTLWYDNTVTPAQWKTASINTILGYTPASSAITLSTTSPLSGGGDLSVNRILSISQATASTNGYLTSTDWNTFNNKQSSLTSLNGILYGNGSSVTALQKITSNIQFLAWSPGPGYQFIDYISLPTFNTTDKGLVPAATSGSSSSLFLASDGTWIKIGTNAIANQAADTVLANNTGSTGAVSAVTIADITPKLNTLIGDTGSGGTKGLVPAPASGDASAGKFLKADGTWAVPAGGGGSSALSAITAATAINTIDNVAYAQEWQWNSLAGGNGFRIMANTTAAASNAQTLFTVGLSGANATSTQATTGAYIYNTHTGTSSSNTALLLSASGGTNNYALIVNGGRVGISQLAPVSQLQINFNQNSVTQSDANGILLANSSAATIGTQSISPPLVWQANGWGTTGSASQDVRFRMDVLPIQAGNAAASFQFAYSTNGSAYTNGWTYSTAQGMTVSSALSVIGTLTRGNFNANSTNVNCGQHLLVGMTDSAVQSYRNINGGPDVLGKVFVYSSTAASGTNGVILDPTNNNGIILSAANGTRHIARASINITNLTNTAGSEAGDMIFSTQSGGTALTQKMRISGLGNVVLGAESALSTSATDGFAYIPTCAGTPTGVPTAYTGKVAMVYDTTNNKFYIYNGRWNGGTTPGVFS